ncbi:Hypothetical protein KFL_009700030 [Klebsormidium nitens]|uniref:Ubiquinol oxidase n=1 Tax=Klebsormidium nitens TaxID=105231 RepID=A0A1Y1ITZ7_KLENI|nr:Hypothetical protein KFL_009700030 [Klebsormidium nitens]|eukprot:GAQ92296.1 Hypothetical protein KFL_009700030 [Klebsormidium nitens]
MEALGGDKRWLDRFLAQHVAVAYYTVAALMYIVSPRMSYHLNECVEKHAYHTYDKFVKEFGDKLKLKPPPEVAVRYYTEGDLYMFGALISPHQDTPSFLSEPCSGVVECSVTAMSAADRALKHGLQIDDAL